MVSEVNACAPCPSVRQIGCRKGSFVPVEPGEARGFSENAEVDQSSLAQLVLFGLPGTSQCDYSCREPPAILIGIGFGPFDLKETVPRNIEGTRQSRVGLVALRSYVGECHI